MNSYNEFITDKQDENGWCIIYPKSEYNEQSTLPNDDSFAQLNQKSNDSISNKDIEKITHRGSAKSKFVQNQSIY
jgi:hypothetical protein